MRVPVSIGLGAMLVAGSTGLTLTLGAQAPRQVDDRDVVEAARWRVDQLWPRLRRDAPQSAEANRPGQRQPPVTRVVHRGRITGQDRDDANRLGRHAVRDVHMERGLCRGHPNRRAQVEVGPGVGQGRLRRERPALLLRPGQPRSGHLQGPRLRRPARRTPRCAQRADRGHRVERPDDTAGQRLLHYRRAAHRQGPGADRQWRR